MNETGTVGAVIVAGGMGKRLGKPIPKAFVPLGNTPLFMHSMKLFDSDDRVEEIVVVVPHDACEETTALIKKYNIKSKFVVVAGGEERWNSVENGVSAVSSHYEWILIHDAARPFVTKEVITSLLEKRDEYEALITATPVVDTIRTFEESACTGTIDRSTLLRVGTPQLFKKNDLENGFNEARQWDIVPTDEAMLMEKCGITVGFAWGDPLNFKVTTPADMEIAEAIISQRNKNL